MIFDNFNFQTATLRELIDLQCQSLVEDQNDYFEIGDLTIVREINGREIQTNICRKIINKINDKGQKILDQLFNERYELVFNGEETVPMERECC